MLTSAIMIRFQPQVTQRKTPIQLLNRAWRLLQRGELDKAAATGGAALTGLPGQFDATYLMGVVRLQQGRLEDAHDLLQIALRLRPLDAGARFNYGNVLVKLRRPSEALVSFDKAITLKPDFAEAHVNRGNVLLEFLRYEESLASYGVALALRPGSVEPLYNLGNALAALKQFDKAVERYEQAIALVPDYAYAHYRRGLALSRLGRFDEAAESLGRAVALQPRNAEFHAAHGSAQRLLGHLEETAESYRRSFELNKAYVRLRQDVAIIDADSVRSLYLGSPIAQSAMRIDAPFDLVYPHTRALMSFQIFNPQARDVLAIGLGGGSLPKFIHRYLPAMRTRAIESEPDVIAVARSHFQLPEDDDRLTVVQADGAQYLADHPATTAALLIDVFDSLGTPRDFYSQKFFDNCFGALAADGVALVHLWNIDAQFALCLERMKRSFADRVLTLPMGDSAIAIGFQRGAGELPWSLFTERAAVLEGAFGIEFGEMLGRLRESAGGKGDGVSADSV
jgi:spermidine synthase